MRDPERINGFCDSLKSLWHTCPDMRFGQLMLCMLGAYASQHGRDAFYIEDDELMEFFRKYLEEYVTWL